MKVRANRWSDQATTPQGSTRVGPPATPPTPGPNPMFTPNDNPQGPERDWMTPCRSSMPTATPGRPPQISRRAANPLGRSAASNQNLATATANNEASARVARLTMGLHAVVQKAAELQRRVDGASAAPLALFETVVGHVQAAEELLSNVRSTIEGAAQRENVCATLLRQADKMHALEEAQRLGVRTPQLTMLARNLVASVSANAATCIKLMRPKSHDSPTSLDGRAEATVAEAARELGLASVTWQAAAEPPRCPPAPSRRPSPPMRPRRALTTSLLPSRLARTPSTNLL